MAFDWPILPGFPHLSWSLHGINGQKAVKAVLVTGTLPILNGNAFYGHMLTSFIFYLFSFYYKICP